MKYLFPLAAAVDVSLNFLDFLFSFANRIAPLVDSKESEEVLDHANLASASEDEVRTVQEFVFECVLWWFAYIVHFYFKSFNCLVVAVFFTLIFQLIKSILYYYF